MEQIIENRKEAIKRLLSKLEVLENRIYNLEVITIEVMNELESVYLKQLNDLKQNKNAAQQKLKQLQETISDD